MPFDWWSEYREVLGWVALGSAGFLVISLATLPWFLGLLPADWFSSVEPKGLSWQSHHPLVAIIVSIGRNAAGVVLLLAGVAMLVLPGQGILTILTAFVLLDLPGKRRFEIYFVRKPRILAALNWLRKRRGVEPFTVPS